MPISSPWGRSTEPIADGLAVAVLVVIAVIAALTFRDYGLGWDDYTHSQYGALLLDLFGSGFTDRRARAPVAGLLALVLLATCPLYYGHMYMNAKDAPFAAAMAVLMLGLVRAFEEYPRPAAATGALLGAGIGLAIGTRILGGFGAVYAIAALLLTVAIEARQTGWRPAATRAGTFILALLPALVLAYAVMALVWPWSVAEPLNPFRALIYFSTFFENPWRELFGGSLTLVPDMPRRYVPQLFALELPEITLALGLGGIVGAL